MVWDSVKESAGLEWSWERLPSELLDEYLVRNQEDPRINCQSILTRALIADSLWPGELDGLIDEDLRFGAALTWLLQRLAGGAGRDGLLERFAEGDPDLPKFVLETHAWLESGDCPVSNYVAHALAGEDLDRSRLSFADETLDSFRDVWLAALKEREASRIGVLEVGCGSANDYRFIDSFGLARFLDYTGIDISGKNVANARRRFPGIAFRRANIFDSGLPDGYAEFVFLHDLCEHLSLAGLGVALKEIMRLCRKQAWLHFFNLADVARHEVRPVGRYHINTLSLSEILKTLREHASQVEVVPIHELLAKKIGCADHYNPRAVTILATK